MKIQAKKWPKNITGKKLMKLSSLSLLLLKVRKHPHSIINVEGIIFKKRKKIPCFDPGKCVSGSMRTRNVREIHAKGESCSFALLSGVHCTIAQLSGQPQHCKKGYPYNDLPHIHRLMRPEQKMTHHKKFKHCSTSSIPSIHTTIHFPQNKR